MEYQAISKLVHVSPRKARLVADAVKKFSPAQAMEKLEFMAQAVSLTINKTLKSAVANATQSGKVKTQDLKIKNIIIDEGVRMKRQDTSHRPGHQGLIHKRTSHIKVILEG